MTQKELEMKIIAHICTYEDDMAELISTGIDEEYFIYSEKGGESVFKNLFLSAKNYYQKYNRLLSQEALENKIKQSKSDSKSNKILSLFIQCLVLDIDHNAFPTLLQQLKSNKMTVVIQDIMHTIDFSLKTEDSIDTFEKIKDKILQTEAELIKNTHLGNKTYMLNKEYTDILSTYSDKKANPEKYKGIEVGLSPIDTITNGFKPSTCNVVVGASGAGKSVILLNWAAEVYKRGYNILFFSLEMPLEQVKNRYTARELCIDYNRLYNGKLTYDEERRLENKLESLFTRNEVMGGVNDPFFGIIVNYDNPGPEYVEEMIRRYQKMYGKIDAIFVDYLNPMRDHEVTKRRGQFWEHSGACASALRGLAAKYDLVSFTAQQLNRSGLERGRKKMEAEPGEFQPHQEDISGSQQAAYDVDSIIGFNPDKKNYKMHFKLIKGRDFYFEPFAVSYYPTMTRIVDPLYDDTQFALSPMEVQISSSHQLGVSADSSLIEEFGDDF